MNAKARYTLYGALFGFCFPAVATLIRVSQTGISAWSIQRSDALLWIIDTAPFFLGLFAFFAGRRQDELERINQAQAQTISDQRIRAIESERLASLGQMAGGIAHEINNPLAIISICSGHLLEALSTGTPDREECASNIEKIHHATNRISKIIKSLRFIAREGDRDPFIEVSTKALITDSLDFFQARFKDGGIDLSVQLPPVDVRVFARPVQISQCLVNLLNNSFDAVLNTSSPWVRIEVKDTGATAELSVTDSGPGIPAELVEKIMQPFFTTKELGKGTGLGLSITNGILVEHGSALTLDTKHPNTRFVFSLSKNKKSG